MSLENLFNCGFILANAYMSSYCIGVYFLSQQRSVTTAATASSWHCSIDTPPVLEDAVLFICFGFPVVLASNFIVHNLNLTVPFFLILTAIYTLVLLFCVLPPPFPNKHH